MAPKGVVKGVVLDCKGRRSNSQPRVWREHLIKMHLICLKGHPKYKKQSNLISFFSLSKVEPGTYIQVKNGIGGVKGVGKTFAFI